MDRKKKKILAQAAIAKKEAEKRNRLTALKVKGKLKRVTGNSYVRIREDLQI